MKHNGFYYYKVDVMGRNGYSFMVKSNTEFADEYDVIDIALEREMFNVDDDANYADVDSLVSLNDIEHFESCGCVRKI